MEETKFNRPKEEDRESESNNKHSKSNLTEAFRKNPWIVSTLVLGVLVLILLAGSLGMTGGTVSEKEIGQQLLEFYEANGAQGLELDSVEKVSGVYQVNFLYKGSTVPIFATKDGKFAGTLSPLSAPSDEPSTSTPTEVPKTDKPVVELFVMTHCPYGTQAEKGIIPTIKALGNVVDAKIRFVHYFMHGDKEEAETYTQVCIREEQSDKFLDYLTCFLEDSDSAKCLIDAKIEKTRLQGCIDSGRAKEYYDADAKASKDYGVQGSPTLIVNGAQSDAGRDSASYLEGICAAFNKAPALCSTLKLSSTAPSPGFGWSGESTGGTDASCA